VRKLHRSGRSSSQPSTGKHTSISAKTTVSASAASVATVLSAHSPHSPAHQRTHSGGDTSYTADSFGVDPEKSSAERTATGEGTSASLLTSSPGSPVSTPPMSPPTSPLMSPLMSSPVRLRGGVEGGASSPPAFKSPLGELAVSRATAHCPLLREATDPFPSITRPTHLLEDGSLLFNVFAPVSLQEQLIGHAVEVHVDVSSYPPRNHSAQLDAILEQMHGITFGPAADFEGSAALLARVISPLRVSLEQIRLDQEVCVRALLHNEGQQSTLRINEIRLDRPLRNTACLPPALPVRLAPGDQYCMLLSSRTASTSAVSGAPAVLVTWSLAELFENDQILSRYLCLEPQLLVPQQLVVRVHHHGAELELGHGHPIEQRPPVELPRAQDGVASRREPSHRETTRQEARLLLPGVSDAQHRRDPVSFPVRRQFFISLTLSSCFDGEPHDLFLLFSSLPLPEPHPGFATDIEEYVRSQARQQPTHAQRSPQQLVCLQPYLHVGELLGKGSTLVRVPLLALSEGLFSLYTQVYDRVSNRVFFGGDPACIYCCD